MVLATLALPTGAWAVFSAPVDLSDPGETAFFPKVAIDQSGDAVFVWSRRDATTGCGGSGCLRVQTRARSAAGALSAVQTLSDPGRNADFAQVAVDPNGNAVFVWARRDATAGCGGSGCQRIQTRARSAAGALSAIQNLSPPGQSAFNPQVAVAPSGNAVFVWSRNAGGTGCGGLGCTLVQTRARTAGGALSAVQTLSDPGGSGLDPHVGVDQGGNAVFVWDRWIKTGPCSSSSCFRVQGRARSATGVLSATQNLSAVGSSSNFPELGVDQSGDAVFAWAWVDRTTNCDGSPCFRIQTRARSAAGALSATQDLSAPRQDPINARAPQVAVDLDGDAVFAWARLDAMPSTSCFGHPGCLRIQARARSAAGALSVVQTLSAPGQHAFTPEVSVDQSGNAVFVWSRPDGVGNCGGPTGFGCSRVQARTRSTAGALGATQTLSAPNQNASQPAVAVDPDGDAVAVWRRFSGRIQAAAGP